MKLFKFEVGDMITDSSYTSDCVLNLDCVTFMREIRYKPNPNGSPKDTWQVGVNGIEFSVTEVAFQRLKRAMDSSTQD